ncbi:hypothetical protein LV78_001946 [Actinosynnema pretiosum]|nr:hypothetical protein [Actinosynnema pretiosum]
MGKTGKGFRGSRGMSGGSGRSSRSSGPLSCKFPLCRGMCLREPGIPVPG